MAVPPTPDAPEYTPEEIPPGFPQPEEDIVEAEADVPVNFEQPLPDLDYDQKEQPEGKEEKSEPEEEEDVLDLIQPKSEPHLWVLGPEGSEQTYIQKPLSFIKKMQWFSLIGDALDKALTGENAMSLNSLFDAPGRPGELKAQDFKDADMFVQAISKLLAAAPNFLVDSYCIWLNVPEYDKKLMSEIMELPEDEGGLSDEMGMEIIEVFLDQNYEALSSFFGERIGKIQRRVEMLNKVRKARASQRSKR